MGNSGAGEQDRLLSAAGSPRARYVNSSPLSSPTVSESARRRAESDGLTEFPPWARRSRRTWGRWARSQIPPDALVIPLSIVTFSCAFADAMTLMVYKVYATSMTGNTVILALAVTGTIKTSVLSAGICLAGFVLAGALLAQIGLRIGHRKRIWILSVFSAQIALLAAGVLVTLPTGHERYRAGGDREWLYLLLLAAQGGIQVTQAATSGIREIPTAMMTTPYAALIADPTLFKWRIGPDTISRDRRAWYILIFWSGGILGGLMASRRMVWEVTLVVLVCKVIAAGVVAFAEEEAEEEDDDEEDIEVLRESFMGYSDDGDRAKRRASRVSLAT